MARVEPDAAGPATGAGATGPVEPIKAVPVRRWGRWIGGAAVLLALDWVLVSAANADNIQWGQVG